MKTSLLRTLAILLIAALQLAVVGTAWVMADADAELSALVAGFREYSGARLVFQAVDLPAGEYYDVMPELAPERRLDAAKIACREVQKFPPGYLESIGFKAIGIFDACASKTDDGFHPYDKELKGYRYYGLYNRRDAVVAAYYSDEQLPLTFHHEIFHHVDRVTTNTPDWLAVFFAPQPFRYPPLRLKPGDRTLLDQLGDGSLLEDAVSRYAAKNPGEDKAETARYLLSALPASLLQAAQRPELIGSQRLLHVLDIYAHSNSGQGPSVDWFLAATQGIDRLTPLPPEKLDPAALVLMLRLRELTQPRKSAALDQSPALEMLAEAEALVPRLIEPAQAGELTRLYAAVQVELLREHIQPAGKFMVYGREDASGVNFTLREDVSRFAGAAQRVARLAKWNAGTPIGLASTQIDTLRLIHAYYQFVAERWRVTPGTRQVFQHTCDCVAATLPAELAPLAVRIMQSSLDERQRGLTADGRWIAPATAGPARADEPKNPYLASVDAEVPTPVRAAIRRVQPACVELSNGSGVNILASGCILTAGHVVRARGTRLTATFPDGRKFQATCLAIDTRLDLAICRLDADKSLPFARLALEAPPEGSAVVCIGQPGESTPEGKPTDYQPFNVSTGHIRGFLDNPLGPQKLGRTKHDAWTYWGHSGSPLFNEQGEIVALHNSWDPETAMRHAITQQAIAAFLAKNLSLATAAE